MSQNKERKTYDDIKSEVLGTYFMLCRDHGISLMRPHDQVLGAVDYSFENVFENPLENLMFKITLLILSGGWYPQEEENLRKNISEILITNKLEKLISDIPEHEREELLNDFKALKI